MRARPRDERADHVHAEALAGRQRVRRRVVRIGLNGTGGPGWLDALPGVVVRRAGLDRTELELTDGTEPDAVLAAAVAHGSTVTHFELDEPSLETLFIDHVGQPADEGERTLAS